MSYIDQLLNPLYVQFNRGRSFMEENFRLYQILSLPRINSNWQPGTANWARKEKKREKKTQKPANEN